VLEQSDIAAAVEPSVEGVAVVSCELPMEDMSSSRLEKRQRPLCERLGLITAILVSEPSHTIHLILNHNLR